MKKRGTTLAFGIVAGLGFSAATSGPVSAQTAPAAPAQPSVLMPTATYLAHRVANGPANKPVGKNTGAGVMDADPAFLTLPNGNVRIAVLGTVSSAQPNNADSYMQGGIYIGDLTADKGLVTAAATSMKMFPTLNGERASSSAVRDALQEGRLEHAARLLGRPYSIDGRVVHGDKIGRQLGFATANIRIKHERPPLQGVFAVEVKGLAGGPHRGAANLGYRPSANQVVRPLLEVHLFDFSADIYGAHLNVRFLHKLRDEVKFPDFNALKAQIASDVEAAKAYFQL